jgi:putative spermidine/putrescine transport system permease protein
VETRATRFGLWTWTVLVVLFLYLPIAIIVVYAFNSSNIQSWPISGFTTKWFASTWHNGEVREALVLSLKAALVATSIALVLGSAGAFAVSRFRFFGRETISFVFVLPLALPGIITGMALNSYFGFWGWQLSIWTIIVGHATFCVVIVYNNVIARLRRISTALVSGALLAFALSFDEVIVTTFTAGAQNTLPLWIFGKIRLGQQLPQVNVVVAVIIALTVIPVYLAQRLSRESGILRRR